MSWEGAGLLLEPGGHWMLVSPGCPSPDSSSLGTIPTTGFIKPSACAGHLVLYEAGRARQPGGTKKMHKANASKEK